MKTLSQLLVATGLFAACTVEPRASHAQGLPRLPRSDVVSAYYLGYAMGPASLDRAARRQMNSGPGLALGLTLGVAFWHEIPVNFGFGELLLEDKQPFTESVVTCTNYNGYDLGCGDPTEQESKVAGAFFTLDTGYERRLQIAEGFAIVPAALVGYLWNPGGMKRRVECDDCTSIPIAGASAAGAYVAPSLRMVILPQQFLSLSVRSQWFVTGSLKYMTLIGLEFLAP